MINNENARNDQEFGLASIADDYRPATSKDPKLIKQHSVEIGLQKQISQKSMKSPFSEVSSTDLHNRKAPCKHRKNDSGKYTLVSSKAPMMMAMVKPADKENSTKKRFELKNRSPSPAQRAARDRSKERSRSRSLKRDPEDCEVDDDDENVGSSDEDQPAQRDSSRPNAFASVMGERKANPLYSFSKNIDYSKITDAQKRLHLKKRSQFPYQQYQQVHQSTVSSSSSQKQQIVSINQEGQTYYITSPEQNERKQFGLHRAPGQANFLREPAALNPKIENDDNCRLSLGIPSEMQSTGQVKNKAEQQYGQLSGKNTALSDALLGLTSTPNFKQDQTTTGKSSCAAPGKPPFVVSKYPVLDSPKEQQEEPLDSCDVTGLSEDVVADQPYKSDARKVDGHGAKMKKVSVQLYYNVNDHREIIENYNKKQAQQMCKSIPAALSGPGAQSAQTKPLVHSVSHAIMMKKPSMPRLTPSTAVAPAQKPKKPAEVKKSKPRKENMRYYQPPSAVRSGVSRDKSPAGRDRSTSARRSSRSTSARQAKSKKSVTRENLPPARLERSSSRGKAMIETRVISQNIPKTRVDLSSPDRPVVRLHKAPVAPTTVQIELVPEAMITKKPKELPRTVTNSAAEIKYLEYLENQRQTSQLQNMLNSQVESPLKPGGRKSDTMFRGSIESNEDDKLTQRPSMASNLLEQREKRDQAEMTKHRIWRQTLEPVSQPTLEKASSHQVSQPVSNLRSSKGDSSENVVFPVDFPTNTTPSGPKAVDVETIIEMQKLSSQEKGEESKRFSLGKSVPFEEEVVVHSRQGVDQSLNYLPMEQQFSSDQVSQILETANSRITPGKLIQQATGESKQESLEKCLSMLANLRQQTTSSQSDISLLKEKSTGSELREKPERRASESEDEDHPYQAMGCKTASLKKRKSNYQQRPESPSKYTQTSLTCPEENLDELTPCGTASGIGSPSEAPSTGLRHRSVVKMKKDMNEELRTSVPASIEAVEEEAVEENELVHPLQPIEPIKSSILETKSGLARGVPVSSFYGEEPAGDSSSAHKSPTPVTPEPAARLVAIQNGSEISGVQSQAAPSQAQQPASVSEPVSNRSSRMSRRASRKRVSSQLMHIEDGDQDNQIYTNDNSSNGNSFVKNSPKFGLSQQDNGSELPKTRTNSEEKLKELPEVVEVNPTIPVETKKLLAPPVDGTRASQDSQVTVQEERPLPQSSIVNVEDAADKSANSVFVEAPLNFESLYRQYQIISQLQELIELRPSVMAQFKKSFESGSASVVSSASSHQAIEGLNSERRVKIQSLCQDWWDHTLEDNSIFNLALSYQHRVQEHYFKSSIQNKALTQDEIDFLSKSNLEKSQCMRECVVLQSVVIGMTAFFSMLSRPKEYIASSYKSELELRKNLSKLIEIMKDQFILCQSYALGMLGGYEACVLDKGSWEHALYTAYLDHIHILFINKKINVEDDYAIFNIKKTFCEMEVGEYIANEANRDFQIQFMTKLVKENSLKLLEQEIRTQEGHQKHGNANLLYVLRDIVNNASEIDFQEGKNHIFEGISNSEVMPSASQSQSSQSPNHNASIESRESLNYGMATPDTVGGSQFEVVEVNSGGENWQHSQPEDSSYSPARPASAPAIEKAVMSSNLIKNFNQDHNQIIFEESVEESKEDTMSVMRSRGDTYGGEEEFGSSQMPHQKETIAQCQVLSQEVSDVEASLREMVNCSRTSIDLKLKSVDSASFRQ